MPFHFYCPQGHMLEGHESLLGQQSQCPICGSVFIMPYPPGMSPTGWPPGYGQPPGYGAPQGYGQPPGGYGPSPPGYQQSPNPGYPNVGQAPGQFVFGGAPAGGAAPWSAGPAPAEPAFPNVAAGQGAATEIPNFGFNAAQTPAAPAEPTAAASAATSTAEQAGAAATEATAEPAPPAEPEAPRIVRIPCPQGHELQTPMDMVNQDVLCPICGAQFHLRYEDSLEFKAEEAERRQRNAERMNALALRWAIGAAVVVVVGIVSMVAYLSLR